MAEDFWPPVSLSVRVAILSGIIVFIFGTLAARLLARKKFRGRLILETLFILPLVLPPSVVGFLLIVIFGKNSPVGRGIEWVFQQPVMFTWWAAVIASVVVAFPLMYQSAKTGFEEIDSDIENAARVDGADEWKVFTGVTIPLAVKSIVAGAILSFARALGEFGATLMFAGNIPGKTQTIPTAIYVAMDSGNMEMAWMWVGTMIVISFAMLMLVHFIRD
ncbi:molybdate ABC transporter permease subunit [Peribacillus glennii]|uniref:Molybdenum transport system permease n=1 Tax=Peribacillus glennii TaxID=2303991 RepID=A0A372L911_9BACI|nr:molybdate ABC transporter permease subunit [Peribacillus glennii]RFU62040.1 molybdate ABC transporter permease subunit [Peribacillus glennii]